MFKFINGPTNYAILKGKINEIEKNIFLFMDTHNKIDAQTKCDSFDSVEISHYLYNKIKSAQKILDFFMEIRLSELDEQITNKKDIYIKEVTDLFKSEFVIDKINEKDLVRYSKSNPNVRLHYLDIRDNLGLFEVSNIAKYKMEKTYNLLKNDKSNDENVIDEYKKKIINYLNQIKNRLDEFKDNINYVIQNNNEKYDKITQKQKYYLNKIINVYNDDELKNNIIEFIDNNWNKFEKDFNLTYSNINYCLESWNMIDTDEYVHVNCQNMDMLIDFIYEIITDFYSLFTDIFLLRRILDKNYINDCICYTGTQHSLNYIIFLVKYYDFEIIHINKIENNLGEIIKKIKKSNNVLEIYKLFGLKKIIQCIKMIHISSMFGGNRLK